jgi:hypothetical protein
MQDEDKNNQTSNARTSYQLQKVVAMVQHRYYELIKLYLDRNFNWRRAVTEHADAGFEWSASHLSAFIET